MTIDKLIVEMNTHLAKNELLHLAEKMQVALEWADKVQHMREHKEQGLISESPFLDLIL